MRDSDTVSYLSGIVVVQMLLILLIEFYCSAGIVCKGPRFESFTFDRDRGFTEISRTQNSLIIAVYI